MLSTGMEFLLQGWYALHRVGIPLYRDGLLSTGLECFGQSCNTFMQGGNALDRVGIPLCRVGTLSRTLECSRRSWNAFDRVGIHL
jgi:hypothetical protein